MAPSLKDLSKYKSQAEKVIKKGKKVVGIAKSAKSIAEDLKASAGPSRCSGKNCSWKEKLEDIAERAMKVGKKAMERKGDIQKVVRKGKKLVQGEEDDEED